MRLPFPAFILGLRLLAGIVLESENARSESACERSEAHVTVIFVGDFTAGVREGALSDLRAALGPQHWGVCEEAAGSQSEKSAALVKVALQNENRVRIEVDDALTNKTVARDIRLQDPDDNASALIVAVAVDELLRATWAELSIKQPPPESTPAPTQSPPPSAPGAESEDARLPAHRVALEGAMDAFVRGSVLFGANIVYGSSIFGKTEWSAFAGPRAVRANNASDLGQVRAEAITFGAMFSVPLLATNQFYFGPELGLSMTHAWFRGRAQSTADGLASDDEFQGWALTARGGLHARVHIGGAFIGAGTRVGYPLSALEVRADSEVVGGMTGLEWSNGLSWGWGWR